MSPVLRTLRLFLFITLLGNPLAQGKDLTRAQALVDLSAIQKLEALLPALKTSPDSLQKVHIRLGDLYAESARSAFSQEIEQAKDSKSNHTESKVLREKSIFYYRQALRRSLGSEEQFQIKLRMASQHNELGQVKTALKLLTEIITNKRTPHTLRQQAQIHRAHSYFTSGLFRQARQDYLAGFREDLSNDEKILIHYRLAWSQFETGQSRSAKNSFEKAIFLLQQTPTRVGQDIYLDYAIFLARDKSSKVQDIQNLIARSHSDFKSNIRWEAASEAFRIARYDLARPLFDEISKDSKAPHLQVGLSRMRLISMQGRNTPVQAFSELLEFTKNCKNKQDCDTLKNEIRSFVVNVHRLKKAKPDISVLQTYQLYLNRFNDEASLFIAAAEVANYLDQHQSSRELYEKAVLAETNSKTKEQYLVANIARAEAHDQPQDKKLSYLFYLQHGTSISTKHKVSFEIAKIELSEGLTQEAFERAHKLATDPSVAATLKRTSSHLAMDAMVQTQNHQKIADVASHYMQLFTPDRQKLEDIRRSAQISLLVTASHNSHKQSKKTVTKNYNEIKSIAASHPSAIEKKNLAKNLVRIADESKLEHLQIDALSFILTLNNLTNKERSEAANSLYAKYIESMSFSKALQLAENNKKSILLTSFELGQLADLSSQKSKAISYYKTALKAKGLRASDKRAAAVRLVHLSPRRVAAFLEYQRIIRQDSKLYDELLSYLIYLNGNPKSLSKLTTRRTPLANQAKDRVSELESANRTALFKKSPKLTHNPSSLNARQKRLDQLDQNLAKSNRSGVLAHQVIWLMAISNENQYFVEELAALPLPRGLSASQAQQYRSQLASLSRPYVEKALMAKHQLTKLVPQLQNLMINERSTARVELTHFLNKEVSVLERIAKSQKFALNLTQVKSVLPERQKEWKSKRDQILTLSGFDKMSQLETQFGNPLLASFAGQQLKSNKKGSQL